MDRYELLVGGPVDNTIIKSGNVRTPERLYSIMRHCINHGTLDVSEVSSEDLVERAIILLSQHIKVPIVTGSDKSAHVLALMHKYPEVYTLENLPDKYVEVLLYYDFDLSKIGDRIKPILVLKRVTNG